MRSEVSVTFTDHLPVQIELHEIEPMPNEAARRWLDEQFTQMGCEPLRPTGKLLTADKVVVVAEAAGPAMFADAQWAQDFARAATAALGKPLVNIDVATLSISY
jgi:tRNA A37 threonylcarbamoyltransferase TsaD